jgi:hypothetical protein
MYRTEFPMVWSSSFSVNVFSYTDMAAQSASGAATARC